MDRVAFRTALGGMGARVVVAMLERHSARLEQLPQGLIGRDPEALSRALRAAQRLYELPAVTVGDGGDVLVRAARLASGGAPEEVLATPVLAVARDAFCRLRAVLRDRAGVVVVLPDPTRLSAEADLPSPAAAAILTAAVRSFGELEPDGVILVGRDQAPNPVHDVLAEFYGMPLIRAGAWVTPRVCLWPDLIRPAGETETPPVVVTPAELSPELQPSEVRSRLLTALAA